MSDLELSEIKNRNARVLNALIPTGGYLLSTLSLPLIKQVWLEKNQIKKEQA